RRQRRQQRRRRQSRPRRRLTSPTSRTSLPLRDPIGRVTHETTALARAWCFAAAAQGVGLIRTNHFGIARVTVQHTSTSGMASLDNLKTLEFGYSAAMAF
ncbi:MAG: hypothetical protein ACPIOQ_33835, partial [Promethearchaeia archaeon]